MSFIKPLLAALSLAILFSPLAHAQPPAHSRSEVIEVVTFKLKPSVSVSEFKKIDTALQKQYVSKQAGFLSRESAATEQGDWLVIVHWRDAASAQASMNHFTSAQLAQRFMDSLQADTMTMTRYNKQH